jgi:SAM-dependent methyltransferase
MPATTYSCRLCGANTASAFAAREMMNGTRETFRYFECPGCGCVQITEIPPDLGRFYPEGYYSFQPPARSLRQRARGAVLRALVAAGGAIVPLRHLLRRRYAGIDLLFLYDEAAGGNHDAAILDIGSGAGRLLQDLVDVGYRDVLGVDRFIGQDVLYRGRTLVRRTDIFAIAGRYDIISFHHSLEHMADQRAVLARARALLAPRGRLIVRIPIVGSEAWQIYGANWVQLDPPRHLYLHSLDSLARVAAQAGLRVVSVVHDSTGFQFWGSELYRRDIPLNDPRSPAVGDGQSLFTAAQMSMFEQRARAANAAGRGDQIVALLQAAD